MFVIHVTIQIIQNSNMSVKLYKNGSNAYMRKDLVKVRTHTHDANIRYGYQNTQNGTFKQKLISYSNYIPLLPKNIK